MKDILTIIESDLRVALVFHIYMWLRSLCTGKVEWLDEDWAQKKKWTQGVLQEREREKKKERKKMQRRGWVGEGEERKKKKKKQNEEWEGKKDKWTSKWWNDEWC